MAKTKILNDIDMSLKQADNILSMLEAGQGYIIPRLVDEMDHHVNGARAGVLAFNKRVKAWDSPSITSRIKNAGKDQAKLKKARADAIAQLAELKVTLKSLEGSLAFMKQGLQMQGGK